MLLLLLLLLLLLTLSEDLFVCDMAENSGGGAVSQRGF